LTGYDVDGVLTAGIKPEGPYIVITGRLMKAWDKTVKEIGTAAPIFMRPFGGDCDRVAAGHWKATVIALCGVSVFYEDDPVQAKVIRERCPTCELRMVVNGKVAA
jgi:hypothetical protein